MRIGQGLTTPDRGSRRRERRLDNTRIKDFQVISEHQGNKKPNLVLHLAQKAIQLCKVPITTHKQKGVLSSQSNMVSIMSTQEEADTLLILYAVAVSR